MILEQAGTAYIHKPGVGSSQQCQLPVLVASSQLQWWKQNVRSESLSSVLFFSFARSAFANAACRHRHTQLGGFSNTDNWQLTLATGATTKGSRPVPDNPDGPRLSWYKPNSVSAFARWRSFVSLGFLSARHRDAGCDYYPRVLPGFPGKRAGNPSLCFVLHHMGFFVRSCLR